MEYTSRHFTENNDQFKNHAKFTLIEGITNRGKAIEVIQDILKKRKNFDQYPRDFAPWPSKSSINP